MENKARDVRSSKEASPIWFMNKVANPFVRLILISPLHGMLSSSIMLITYRGRKSGKKYMIPVQYVQQGDLLYIIPGAASQKTWWRNLRGGTPVEVLLQGHHLEARAEVLAGEMHSDVIAGALKLFLQRFPAATRLHAVRVNADGTLDAESLNRAAVSVILVRVKLPEAEVSCLEKHI